MKRREFIRKLIEAGCYLKRHGANHDIYMNPRTGRKTSISRHAEIPNDACKEIMKQLGLPINLF